MKRGWGKAIKSRKESGVNKKEKRGKGGKLQREGRKSGQTMKRRKEKRANCKEKRGKGGTLQRKGREVGQL